MEIQVFDKYADFPASPSGTMSAQQENAEEYFYLKPEDDSMAPQLEPGVPALFKKQRKAKNGDIVFASIGNQSYIRRISYDKDFLDLYPVNDAYEKLSFVGFSLNRVKIKGVLQ